MNELDCQKLLVEAVREVDGCGVLFNNRFIVGVPDLLLQIPGHGAMILEAKLFKFSAKTLKHGHAIQDIGVTAKQRMYLRDWNRAGMLTGVVSFVMEQGADVRSLRMKILAYEQFPDNGDWAMLVEEHTPLGDKPERLLNIRQQLIGFANG